MAQTEIDPSSHPDRRRAELIATLAAARSGMGRDARELADLADVPKLIRATISKAPIARTATALAAGLIGSRFLLKRASHPDPSSPGWFQRTFPEIDWKEILRQLATSYLELDQADLRALLRERLRDLLK